MSWLFDSPKACFGFCTLLFDLMLTSFTLIKFQRGERSREFRVLVIVITISTFFEFIRVYIQELPFSPLNLFLKNTIMSVCFIGTLSIAYTYSVYLVSFVHYKSNLMKIFRIINLIAFLADIIFLIVDIRFGLSCTYSEMIRNYVRGPMYLPSAYYVPGYLLGFSIVVFWGDRKISFRAANSECLIFGQNVQFLPKNLCKITKTFLRHFPQKADPAQVYSCCDRTGKREGFRIRAVNTDYDVEATESAIEIAEMRFFGYHPDIRSVTKTDEK